MAETEPAKPTPRPIIRIGLFLMSHNLLVRFVSFYLYTLLFMFAFDFDLQYKKKRDQFLDFRLTKSCNFFAWNSV